MPKKLYYTLLMTLMNSIFGMFHLIYVCVIFYINKALITNTVAAKSLGATIIARSNLNIQLKRALCELQNGT